MVNDLEVNKRCEVPGISFNYFLLKSFNVEWFFDFLPFNFMVCEVWDFVNCEVVFWIDICYIYVQMSVGT